MTQDPKGRGTEPDWLDPRKDRKTPYSDQELELFVEGFVSSMGDVADWNQMVKEIGEIKAREVLKEGFRPKSNQDQASACIASDSPSRLFQPGECWQELGIEENLDREVRKAYNGAIKCPYFH